jgi:hypothetical protein
MSLPKSLSRNRLLALVPAAVLLLAGCGGDTCSSSAAEAEALPSNCTLAANTTATIQVRLCAKCSDSSPACTAEFVNDQIELDPTFQQCQANAGCAETGCALPNSLVTCSVTTPDPGIYTVVAGSNLLSETVSVEESGAGTSCTL